MTKAFRDRKAGSFQFKFDRPKKLDDNHSSRSPAAHHFSSIRDLKLVFVIRFEDFRRQLPFRGLHQTLVPPQILAFQPQRNQYFEQFLIVMFRL